MMPPKKLIKSMSATGIPSSSVDSCNTNSDNEVLVYENGTVLGAVVLIEDTTTDNNSNNDDSISSSLSVNINKIYLNSNQNCDTNQNRNNSMNNSYSINENSISIDENNCCVTLNQNHIDIDSGNLNENDNSDCRILNETITSEIENHNNNNNNCNQTELLNSSICSRDSRQSKQRSRLQFTKKSHSQQQDEHHQHEFYGTRYPPQYTAIYFDANSSGGGGASAGDILISDNLNQIQQFDSVGGTIGLALPVVHRNSGIDSDQRRGIFRKWFRRPSLPFIVGVLALGGVACTLGGIVLGSTGLVEHSTQYLSAALLMIGIGVSLLVISGAIWRLTIPDETENCPCFRHLETCRNCNSPFCSNRIIQAGFMYPEFQHRPPPPSYLTSLNECTVGLLLHHEVSTLQRNDTIRLATPPPVYRSSNSLSVFVPLHHHNVNSADVQRTCIETVEQNTTASSTVENPNSPKENPSPVEI